MRNVEFVAARYLAARTKRPNLAFGMLVAMLSMDGAMYCERIACLLGVSPIAVSTVAKELADLDFIQRDWTPSAANVAPMGDHGRKRIYTLTPEWLSMVKAMWTPLEWDRAQAGICPCQNRGAHSESA